MTMDEKQEKALKAFDTLKYVVTDIIASGIRKKALADSTYSYSDDQEWAASLADKSLAEIESEATARGLIDPLASFMISLLSPYQANQLNQENQK